MRETDFVYYTVTKHRRNIMNVDNYIPEKRKFSGILCFRQQRTPPPPPPPPPHNLVSAITFEGFKLRSSNLTHALLIQISRTSSIIDIVVPSKMAAGGHFVKPIPQKSSVLIWNGQKCHPKWISNIQNVEQLFKNKFLYRSEIARNAILKWISDIQNGRRGGGSQNLQKNSKVANRSEMARNAIESEFRTSKMAAGSHFVKKKQILYRSEMARSCDRKWISDIQNGARQPFCQKFKKN